MILLKILNKNCVGLLRDGRAAVPSYKGIHKLKFIAFTICRGTISTPHLAEVNFYYTQKF